MTKTLNITNSVWQRQLTDVYSNYSYIVKPRGLEVHEIINGSYSVPMPAYIDLKVRKVNYPFMFAEAAWIISGSNRLEDLESYMPKYKDYSDEGVFLKGAYGPKIVDQLPYIVETLIKDKDSRQALLTIWRERPSGSKDIPCTISLQFLVRDNHLHCIANMRSNDIVLGFTYDVFSFSMVALAVKLLLKEQGYLVNLGELYVNAGSLHLYEQHYDKVEKWIFAQDRYKDIKLYVDKILESGSYSDLIKELKSAAKEYK